MIRYKWLSSNSLPVVHELMRNLSKARFRRENGFGFELKEHEHGFLTADCITRITETRRIQTPLGTEEIVSFDTYERVTFSIISAAATQQLIRLHGTPKSLANLLRALEAATGKKPFVSKVEIPLIVVKEALSGFLFKLTAAELGNVVYGRNMVGKALISSTEERSLDNFGPLSKLPYRLEGFKAVAISGSESVAISVTRSNTLILRGALWHSVLERIEKSLCQQLADAR